MLLPVRVQNDGWYVAEFSVTYWDFLRGVVTVNSGHITLGRSAVLFAPNDREVYIHVREWTGFAWKTIVADDYIAGLPYPGVCYRLWGTTWDPHWDGCWP